MKAFLKFLSDRAFCNPKTTLLALGIILSTLIPGHKVQIDTIIGALGLMLAADGGSKGDAK